MSYTSKYPTNFVTATYLGKLAGISALAVNKALREMGFLKDGMPTPEAYTAGGCITFTSNSGYLVNLWEKEKFLPLLVRYIVSKRK